jgi:hypothetical protein
VDLEQCLARYNIKKKEYMTDYRILKNWENAWLLMNKRPDDLKDYLLLKEEMRDIHTRLKKMKAPDRITAEERYRRYRELQGRCEKLLEAQVMLERCREQKEQSQKVLSQASKVLEATRKKEKDLADCITDDHVTADRAGKSIASCFPKIQLGMIISKLNHVDTEDLDFEEILDQLEEADQPHRLEFRRYDYIQSIVSGEWESLQSIRIQGKYLVDPRTRREAFVEAGQRGDVFELKVSLEHGEDIDAVDSTGATAFFHATSNGHFAAMNLLRQRTLARSPPFAD